MLMSPEIQTTVVDPDIVDQTDLLACYKYWHDLTDGRMAPTWKEFHLYELPPILIPYIFVLDVENDSTEFSFRFWGSGHTYYYGSDYTGKKVGSIEQRWISRVLQEQYLEVVDQRKPLVFKNKHQGIEEPLLSLQMPLSEDGKTVTHIFSYLGWRDFYYRMLVLAAAKGR